jgi:hypothetical protein
MVATPTQSRILKFALFEVDLEAGELRKSGMRQKLAGQPFEVLRLIRLKQLPATQACMGAPWILHSADVERRKAERNRPAPPPTVDSAQLALEIP